MKFLENFFDKNRPPKDNYFFYLYEVVQNFFFSAKLATTGKTHSQGQIRHSKSYGCGVASNVPSHVLGHVQHGLLGVWIIWLKVASQTLEIGTIGLFSLLGLMPIIISTGFGWDGIFCSNLCNSFYCWYRM